MKRSDFEKLDSMIPQIESVITLARSMKNAYFFKPSKNAGCRRAYERDHSRDLVMWKDGKTSYSAAYETICSVNNVYARGYYTKDGKPTTLTAISNSYNRLWSKWYDERKKREARAAATV